MWSTHWRCIQMDASFWFMCVTAYCACWTWGAIPSCNATLVPPTSKNTYGALSAHAALLLSRAQRMAMHMCGTRKQVSHVIQPTSDWSDCFDQWGSRRGKSNKPVRTVICLLAEVGIKRGKTRLLWLPLTHWNSINDLRARNAEPTLKRYFFNFDL